MKIVSINLESTDKLVSANLKDRQYPPHSVAFNLDRPLSPRAKKKLPSCLSDFPGLSIKVNESGLCLTVKNTSGSIDSDAVKFINEKLEAIEKEEQSFFQKRKEELQAIAENTKLDFDQPLESVEPDEFNVIIGG
ncbi:hypothetical protein [Candidatus Electronema sp. JC]|uniref:hypothetical protein n=1 Tax=Candidatus Electronema sp. JC TaxID=3401570 RepID=UPI003B43AFD5